MKTKICEICSIAADTMFRVQIATGKNWIFVCQSCCEKSKSLTQYKYGGTWKGKRH
ncbi:hypothetical protein [Flavobacterium sp. CECT 9288]|uniref:hypothetical protein n=1 Tax=Flavobacterium sp. CECT 9288 TaxID=2845819 RepID=UPI001E33F6C4|nr:hypothetical protein [Flavobacterium sp. CECT 9288]